MNWLRGIVEEVFLAHKPNGKSEMEAAQLKVLHCLALLSLFLNCGSASADNWRDDNPNQPNGYAASMYRYHHGTPDPETHNGYAATSVKTRYGLDRFDPPDDSDSGSRWGGGDGGGRFGGGGSGLGRHFRQGQAEGEAIWTQRLQNHMQASAMQSGGYGNGMQSRGYGMQSAGFGNMQAPMQSPGYANGGAGYAGVPTGQMQRIQSMASQYQNQGFPPGEQPQQRFCVNNQIGAASGNCQYAPSNGENYANTTALRQAVGQRPIGSLLRNSQGGFNRIYYPQQ